MEAAAYTEAEEALALTESVSRREVVGGGGRDFSAVLSQVKKLEIHRRTDPMYKVCTLYI
jgi:hypothetical protein